MALNVPFVNWVYNPIDPESPRSGGAYQMNTGEGRSEIIALAINTGGDHLYYNALPSFIQNYGGIIPLGNDVRWNIKRCFVAWMESIIDHSFLHHSLAGVENCWFMKDVSAYSLTTLTTIPIGFRNTFNGDNQTIWILLKHGKKAWPVQVINNVFFTGWASFRKAHALRPNFRLVFATERKWIFNVFILNENNVEVQFPWSQPNPAWVNLFPIPVGLVTSCIPSVFANQQSSKKFGHQYVASNHVAPVFQGQLNDLIHENPTQQLTIKVGNFVWVVPVYNGYLHYPTLEQFIDNLDLDTLDYLFVSVSGDMELTIIVFDYYCIEKVYEWF